MQSARILRHSKCRKAEKPIGHAGNDERRPERYPARGIKGRASKQCDLRDDTRQKPILFGLPEASRGETPRGVQEGTESSPGDALCRTPGYSHLAQPAEPPYADPHVRWCGRGGRAIVPPIPIPSRVSSSRLGNLRPPTAPRLAILSFVPLAA
jgi:hypothetical protein